MEGHEVYDFKSAASEYFLKAARPSIKFQKLRIYRIINTREFFDIINT